MCDRRCPESGSARCGTLNNAQTTWESRPRLSGGAKLCILAFAKQRASRLDSPEGSAVLARSQPETVSSQGRQELVECCNNSCCDAVAVPSLHGHDAARVVARWAASSGLAAAASAAVKVAVPASPAPVRRLPGGTPKTGCRRPWQADGWTVAMARARDQGLRLHLRHDLCGGGAQSAPIMADAHFQRLFHLGPNVAWPRSRQY